MPVHLFDKSAIARAGSEKAVDTALDSMSPADIAAEYEMSVQEVRSSVIANQVFSMSRPWSTKIYLLSVIEEAASWITEPEETGGWWPWG